MVRWRPAPSSLRAAFIAASLAWAVLLVTAPFLSSRAHASPLASVLILGVYSLGSLICHQLPERSYHMWTAQMPVCARCAGIYVGAVLGAVAGAVRTAKSVRHTGPEVAQGCGPAKVARVALALAFAPTLLTLVYEWMTVEMPSHAIRAAAGLPIGLVVAWLVVAAADNRVD